MSTCATASIQPARVTFPAKAGPATETVASKLSDISLVTVTATQFVVLAEAAILIASAISDV